VLDLGRQTLRNLWHDRALLRPSTWSSAARLLFGRDGFVRDNVAGWRTYLAPDFHPSQHGGEAGARWLAEHADAYTAVGQAPTRSEAPAI
jgi:predicted metal-dependent hydrolase